METANVELGIEVDSMDQLIELFGAVDENAKAIEKETGASIASRNTHIEITGKEEEALLAKTVVDKLLTMIRKREKTGHFRKYGTRWSSQGRATPMP